MTDISIIINQSVQVKRRDVSPNNYKNNKQLYQLSDDVIKTAVTTTTQPYVVDNNEKEKN
jgi:hypothetical protein